MMPPTEDLKNFQNPQGYWSHVGPFTVELTADADMSIVPDTAQVCGDVVRVHQGSAGQSIGGIQLISEGSPFFWGYSRIKVIRDGAGNLIWVNHDYR